MQNGSGPLFFLSYARPQNRAPVRKFFDDLSEMLAELVALRTGMEPGFMDLSSIQAGEHWTPELLRAIGTSKVFVALLSAPYLSREWCSMEWYAFAQRRIMNSPDGRHSTAIIPVIWAPLPATLPRAVHAIQRFVPDLPNPEIALRYRKEGLYGLIRGGVDREAYEPTVWRLAQEVARVIETSAPEPLIMRREELRDPFREET